MKKHFLVACGIALLLAFAATITPAQAALPTNLSWIKEATNPVVSSSLCYSGDHFDPALVIESANNYKMYFSGRDDGANIYLATTSDGGLHWSCVGSVVAHGGSGAWDEKRAMSPAVIKDGATYKMWYTGYSAAGVYAIGYATSGDGASWTKVGTTPVLQRGTPSAWDSDRVREPSVLKVGGTYHMWYSGTAKWPFFRIGHATSSDGVTWLKDSGNPVLTPTAGSWDANEVYAPSVVENGGSYEMFYSGNGGGRWISGHATAASAGGPWTKDSNAIVSPDATGWEAGFDSTDYVGAVLDGSTWKVFYSAGGTYQIGLTTLANQPLLTFNQLAASLKVGDTKTVTIDINNVTDLYGYQFEVHYDASKVSAAGSFINTFFDTAHDALIAWNATCASGVCKFAVSKNRPAGTPSTGSGTLAQIVFTGVAPGDTTLTFVGDLQSEEEAVPIPHANTSGFLTVYGVATVSGTVHLQGRSPAQSNAGTVTIYDQYGYAPPVTVAFAAGTGAFTANVAVHPDSPNFDIQASHSLYLTNQETGITLSNGGSYPQPATTLKGGDADNSGKLDVSDLACIGADFGLTPTNCGGLGGSDITNDGNVNIFDLVLLGGNYDLASPQPW